MVNDHFPFANTWQISVWFSLLPGRKQRSIFVCVFASIFSFKQMLNAVSNQVEEGGACTLNGNTILHDFKIMQIRQLQGADICFVMVHHFSVTQHIWVGINSAGDKFAFPIIWDSLHTTCWCTARSRCVLVCDISGAARGSSWDCWLWTGAAANTLWDCTRSVCTYAHVSAHRASVQARPVHMATNASMCAH